MCRLVVYWLYQVSAALSRGLTGKVQTAALVGIFGFGKPQQCDMSLIRNAHPYRISGMPERLVNSLALTASVEHVYGVRRFLVHIHVANPKKW